MVVREALLPPFKVSNTKVSDIYEKRVTQTYVTLSKTDNASTVDIGC